MNGVFSTESNNPELRETTVAHSNGFRCKFQLRWIVCDQRQIRPLAETFFTTILLESVPVMTKSSVRFRLWVGAVTYTSGRSRLVFLSGMVPSS